MVVPTITPRALRNVLTCSAEEAFGPTPWLTLDQTQLATFVEATNPPQGRGDLTISQNNELGDNLVDGLLLLSLLPHFTWSLWPFGDKGTWALNYGYDRVRFVTPAYVGDEIRMSLRVLEASERDPGRVLVKTRNTIELKGQERPAVVADSLLLFIDGSEPGAVV